MNCISIPAKKRKKKTLKINLHCFSKYFQNMRSHERELKLLLKVIIFFFFFGNIHNNFKYPNYHFMQYSLIILILNSNSSKSLINSLPATHSAPVIKSNTILIFHRFSDTVQIFTMVPCNFTFSCVKNEFLHTLFYRLYFQVLKKRSLLSGLVVSVSFELQIS